MKINVSILSAFAMATLAACGGDDDGTGRLSLAVTDAPVDGANAVVVEFTGVEVKPAEHDSIDFTFDDPRTIDLLALAGAGSETLLEGVEVPAGRYDWVRLKVAAVEDGVMDSFVELKDGSQHELEVPSGAQTGLKLVSGFVVPHGGDASFTIDFDLRKSVHEPMDASPTYLLRPALRIVDNARVGVIAGTVDNALVTDGCTPAVYVFEGGNVTPDDVDAASPDPVTTGIVKLDDAAGTYRYRVEFLSEGEYTVSFTCGAATDDPDTSETLAFAGTRNVSVVANQVATADFAAP
jgi:hypothetical protein